MGAAGVALACPWGTGTARAEPYEGPLLLTINALGGWDISNFCDPKGTEMNQRYEVGDILTAGAIDFAPLDTNADFFNRFHSEMLLINGIDVRTAGHTEAARHMWSGEQANVRYPSIAALFAARHLEGSELPLPFISSGGYSATSGLLPLTRLGTPLTLQSIALHERERGIENQGRYAEDFALNKIYEARKARHESAPKNELPRFRKQRSALHGHQVTTPLLRRYREYLPDEIPGQLAWLSQVATSLACLKAGVSASASVYVSDFDTHSDHENLHSAKLQELLLTITFAVDRATELGLIDRLTILITSEFSRTPEYGSNGGKDHWPTNSMILMGPGIVGNRVIGATDEGLVPRNINLETLALDDANGQRLYPGHIMTALREHLDLQDFAVANGMDLRMPTIPLFT